MPDVAPASTGANPTVALSLFRDARDVIPRRAELPWLPLCRLLAPARPPVRNDVTNAVQRQQALVDQARDAVLSGRGANHLQHIGVFRDLEKVAFLARAESDEPDEITARVEARAEQLRDGARRRGKLRLGCWSPTVYRRHETRGAGGVDHVTCVVLDYDDGTPIEDAMDTWEGWPLLVHTSWSHTEDHPRFRLVLPLAAPIPAMAWPRVWAWARERSGGHIDEACKDPSRLYLLPAVPRFGAPFHALVRGEGRPLLSVDLDALPGVSPPRPKPASLERVRVPEDQARLIARYRLRTSREVGERAARWLDAHLTGTRAERIPCPGCGRPSVWFWLEPGRMSTAVCDHRNSCGWWGHLDELLDARSVSHG
jgi:hypothetical protein